MMVSEISDKALAHAIYLSKLSNAEIVILNAVEGLHEIAPTTISAGQSLEAEDSDRTALTTDTTTSMNIKESNNEELNVTI